MLSNLAMIIAAARSTESLASDSGGSNCASDVIGGGLETLSPQPAMVDKGQYGLCVHESRQAPTNHDLGLIPGEIRVN